MTTTDIDTLAIPMTVASLMGPVHGFRPHEAYLIAAEQFPGREAEVELATLRRALRLQPGRHVCGMEDEHGEPCLIDAKHVEIGTPHVGLGTTWEV